MNFIDLLILSTALSVDSVVLLITLTFLGEKGRVVPMFRLVSVISCMHFLMILLGSYFSASMLSYVGGYSNYVAAAIFAFIGINFLRSLKQDEVPNYTLTFSRCVILSYLVSVDALAAGFSLRICQSDFSVLFSATIVALVVLFLSSSAYFFARYLKGKCSTWNTTYLLIVAAIFMFILAFKVLFF